MTYQTFQTEYRVRPDDIDMFNHVHNSKYFDYVLAARYDHMELFYGRGMQQFLDSGYGWLVSSVHMDFKRALKLGDYFFVNTGIVNINEKKCKVHFTITAKATNKVSCDGWFEFVMIDLKSGKGVLIPADIIEQYAK